MSTIRFVLYARKSSESEDRQVQSIDDQLGIMRSVAERHGLTVIEEITEEKSAKVPYNRPGFDRLMQMLYNDEADGVLVYHINRLSRNRLESGMLEQYLQDSIIEEIRTSERSYYPDDNAFLLAIEGAQANQSNRDSAKVIKRGMESKAKKGWLPHAANIGYINDRNTGTIVPDPDRFMTLRKAWDLAIEGYSVGYIVAKLTEWGFITRPRNRSGGRPINKSTLHAVLTNPFYSGQFLYKGELLPGNHHPMVTIDEFETVQNNLRRGVTYREHTFTYSGLLRCGECGCAITAEAKQRSLATGEARTYTYYHCTKKRAPCSQVSVSEAAIDERIGEFIRCLEIDPECCAWGITLCKRWLDDVASARERTFDGMNVQIKTSQSQLDELLTMRLNREITSDEYNRRRETLLHTLNKDQQRLRLLQGQFDAARVDIEHVCKVCEAPPVDFAAEKSERRRELAMDYGLTYTLQDGHIACVPNPAFQLVREAYLEAQEKSKWIEPAEIGSDKAKSGLSGTYRSVWWAILDEKRNRWADLKSSQLNYRAD